MSLIARAARPTTAKPAAELGSGTGLYLNTSPSSGGTSVGEQRNIVACSLKYNSARIRATHTYAIQARITTKNGLRLINALPYPVITKGNPSVVDVTLKSAKYSQAD